MAQRTKNAIRQSFMELLAERPFDKITIGDIAQRSEITRNAFYYYYQDIYALANAMEDEMVHAVVESLPRLTASDVVRHALVQRIVAAYDKFEKTRLPDANRTFKAQKTFHQKRDRT